MTKLSRPVFLVILLLFLHRPIHASSDQIILRSDDQFRFAQEMMERGEYQGAVNEFERFIQFFPQDERVPKARYLVGLSYLEGKAYEPARRALHKVLKAYPGMPLAGDALFLIGESYYRQGISEEATYYFEKVIERYPWKKLKDASFYRLGWSRMRTNHWQKASKTFQLIEESSPLYASAKDLSRESLKGELLPYKNPTAAGFLAAFIPGLGHAYLNRYKDGMVALLLNGLFIWAAVESFNEDLEVLGGILTFLEFGWYSGNIYSAVNGTHKYNRKVKNDFLKTLRDRLDLNIFSSREGHLGLALKIHF